MEDTDFFDTLYQGWSKTTGAENTFWMPEECYEGGMNLFAVDEKQNKTPLGWLASEADAAWITALHGCFADLVRRLHMAVDEAERFSVERDEQEGRIAEVALELQNTQETLMHTTDALSMIKGESRRQLEKIEHLEAAMEKIDQENIRLNSEVVRLEEELRYWSNR